LPADSEALYEVVDGVVEELPPMGIYSIWIALELYDRLRPFVRQHKLGWVVAEGLFILREEPDLRRRPDVAFVSADRWPLDRPLPETGDWAVVPNLAVEVISPNDLFDKVQAKLDEYFSLGVRQVWLIVPKFRKLYVYESPTRARILTGADTLQDTVVPGLTLRLDDLLQGASGGHA
jgi:Uma2 family endonuclease